MGIYDREYYRDETRGSGWLSGLAPACKTLILVNVAVYVAQVVFRDAHLGDLFAARGEALFRRGHVWQLLTAAFLHDEGNPFHLIWNMLFLWMAGREVESLYGSREFVRMYLTAAVVSTLCWAVGDVFGLGRENTSMLGASGAVMAVVVIYTLYNPRREVLFFFVLPIEMWLLVVIYLGCDFVFLMQQMHGEPTMVAKAFGAHLGGAAYGYLYKTLDLRWSRLFDLAPRRRVPRLRIVEADSFDRDIDLPMAGGTTKSMTTSPASRPAPNVVQSDEQFEARLDEVLAKIGRDGRDGLTEEDNRILQEASRRARDRRSDRVR